MTDAASVFLVSYDRLTWRVSLNGVAFGAYRSRQNAVKAVNEARRTPDLQSALMVMGAVAP
jgi:hypothetical protein